MWKFVDEHQVFRKGRVTTLPGEEFEMDRTVRDRS